MKQLVPEQKDRDIAQHRSKGVSVRRLTQLTGIPQRYVEIVSRREERLEYSSVPWRLTS